MNREFGRERRGTDEEEGKGGRGEALNSIIEEGSEEGGLARVTRGKVAR